MTFVSNDPSFWPVITDYSYYSYCIVASCAVVVYDWVLTFGQEFDLVLRQRWSFMTFLYVAVRYSGLLFCSITILMNCTSESASLTDAGCTILANMENWMSVIINPMVAVIMITRLYAMYQQSRIILSLLVFMCSALTISSVVITIIQSRIYQFEEFVLSGQYMCACVVNDELLTVVTWILATIWEVLALSLAVWIAIKHFRELSTIEGCFAVLIRSHVFYFVSFTAVACLNIGEISQNTITNSQVYSGILRFAVMVQMFVLAPRLILSIRQYNAQVVAESDEAIAMTSIAFQERTRMSNGNDV